MAPLPGYATAREGWTLDLPTGERRTHDGGKR